MFFHRVTIPGLAIHSYLIGDETVKECACIDPVRDGAIYLKIAEKHNFKIKHILETHVHADFVSGAAELKHRLGNGAQIHCSGLGGKEWTPAYADRIVQEGDEVMIGTVTLKAVHTPGHTPEHLMWTLSENGVVKKLFTGDFLFVGSVGRPDLLGPQEMERLAEQLYESVFTKLRPYPDNAEVCPAHGAGSFCGKGLGADPSSTLGRERKNNPYLQKKPLNKWVEDLLEDMPLVPNYFSRMKKINVTGAPVIGETIPGTRELTPEAVEEEKIKGAVILDTGTKEEFATGHIPDAINIPFTPSFSTWAGWILPPKAPIVLVTDHLPLREVLWALLLIGLDNIVGTLKGGKQSWREEKRSFKTLPVLTPNELYSKIQHDEQLLILDVRTAKEWELGHIPEAFHVPLGLLQEKIDSLPKNQPIAVICGSGQRSSVAASLLQKRGFKNVSNVFGGMTAWKHEGLPIG